MLHSTRRCNPPAPPTNPHQGIRSTVLTDQKTHHHVPPPWASALNIQPTHPWASPDPACFQARPGFPSNSCLCAPIPLLTGSTLPLLRRRFRQGTRRTPKRLFGCLTVCTSVTSAGGLCCTGRLNLRVCVHIAHRHIPSPTHGNCTLQPPRPIAPSRPRPAPAPAVPFITQPYRYLVRLEQTLVNTVCQSASLPVCCLPAATGPQFVAGCSSAPCLARAAIPISAVVSRPSLNPRDQRPATGKHDGPSRTPPLRLVVEFPSLRPRPRLRPILQTSYPVLPRLGHLPPSSLRDPSRAVTFPGPPLLGFGSCS